MAPVLLPFRLKALVHQHEGGEENKLNPDDKVQEGKWVRIEGWLKMRMKVDNDPSRNEYNVCSNKPETAEETGHAISDPFDHGASAVQGLLDLSNCFNILLCARW